MRKNQESSESQIHRLDRSWSRSYSLNDFLDGETPLTLDPDDRNVVIPVGSGL